MKFKSFFRAVGAGIAEHVGLGTLAFTTLAAVLGAALGFIIGGAASAAWLSLAAAAAIFATCSTEGAVAVAELADGAYLAQIEHRRSREMLALRMEQLTRSARWFAPRAWLRQAGLSIPVGGQP